MFLNDASPYLAGNFAPVTEELTAFDLPVTGQIPEELEGRLLRNGPNPIDPPDMAHHHWFIGDGMVQDTSGDVIFKIQFFAIACCPEENEVLDGKVIEVTTSGI